MKIKRKNKLRLKTLKTKEQTKAIEDKSSNKNNQSIILNIFNDFIKKRQSIMSCIKVLIRINYILSM